MNPLVAASSLGLVGAGICLLLALDEHRERLRAWVVRGTSRLFAVERTRRALTQAGLTWLPVGTWIAVRIGASVVAGALAYLFFGVLVLALVGALVVYHLLGLALELRRRQAQLEWQEALVEAIRYGGALMERGGSATEMLSALGRTGPAPVRGVFAELAGAAGSQQALVREMRDRVADPLFDDIALALDFSWTRGAKLASALKAIAEEWEENIRLQREARALRAGVEASVIILACLPMLFLALFQSMAPRLIEPYRMPAGQVLIAVAALWMVLGYRVLHRMAAPPLEERLSLKEMAR